MMKMGDINEALVIFRTIIDKENVNNKISCYSCQNMGIIAHIKGDYDFSLACSNEYVKINEHDRQFGIIWMDIENQIESKELDHIKAIELNNKCDDKKSARFVQSTSATYWIYSKRHKEGALFLELVKDNMSNIHANMLICAFEYYYQTNKIQMMKRIIDDFNVDDLGTARALILDYFNLCLKITANESVESKLILAKRVICGIKTRAIFNSSAMLKICGLVVKESDNRNRILVPSRFGMIGISPVLSSLRDRLERYARSNSPVLVTGESGTGKELAAQALHDAGDRAAAPFIPVNCAAIPESVFESQLFGHVAGAFTGAAKDQPGLIELAGEGTLFLDEVGELPAGVQAKLLRFLENGEYRRLGGERTLKSRARIVAATNRGLGEETGFRQDLYHRLRRLEIQVPPLRERREDIRYLARQRIRQLNLQDGSGWKQLDEAAEAMLEGLDYAGNVRELFNLVDHAWHEAVQQIGPAEVERARQRLAAESRAREEVSARKSPDDLCVSFPPGDSWSLDFESGPAPLRHIQERAACAAIRQALAHFDGDVDETARFLDVSRRSIYRYLERGRQEA